MLTQHACRSIAALFCLLAPLAIHAQQPAPPPVDTGYVTYGSGAVSLPLGIGFRLPTYDRVNGVSLPWGPKIATRDDRIVIDALVTYRSHLGEFDPSIRLRAMSRGGFGIDFDGGRSTVTNDGWMRSDITNSVSAIAVGTDARNYYRSDRGTLYLNQTVGPDTASFRLRIGAQHEYDWSTGSRAPVTSHPWSVFGRTDSLKMRRPNPEIARGHVTSGLAGIDWHYETEDLSASIDVLGERAFDVRVDGPADKFSQITIGSKAKFSTFGTQSFEFRGHFVTPLETEPPPQRYVYLGGGGTLSTVDLLALGGDHLLYAEGEYFIPIDSLYLPFVGVPTVLLRYAAGSAGVGELPRFIQNITVGVMVKLLKVQFHYDPSYRETPFTKKSKLSVGLSLPTI